MGFEVPAKTYRLVFEDEDYAGAEVRCRSTSIGRLNEIASSTEAMRLFGDEILIDWNLTENGEPVPATGEGMVRVPVEFGRAILNAWTQALVGISGPLGGPSSNGAGSAVPEIPMVILSESPPS